MAREHSAGSLSGVNLAGTIGDALLMHARERAIHFFLFLFALDATCRRVAVLGTGLVVEPAHAFEVAATHQIDSGFRSTHIDHYDFDETDPKVVDKPSTSCRRTDAAHFCNLGLEARVFAQLAAAGGRDAHARDLLDMAKRLAGNTKQLPQRVNIGPDRVIDVLHGELAGVFLRAARPMTVPPRNQVMSRANLAAYLAAAIAAMTIYRAQQVVHGRHGLAACCDSYLIVYANHGETIWMSLTGYIAAEALARRDALNLDDYLNW
ncbi:hypothetical protein [Glacieibacterium sp.]|uniref:hypothetical protein n=1 Tax=Glacieibacterium sp. TaxID=2860237 RepID=UPI003AFFD931